MALSSALLRLSYDLRFGNSCHWNVVPPVTESFSLNFVSNDFGCMLLTILVDLMFQRFSIGFKSGKQLDHFIKVSALIPNEKRTLRFS